jgi:hypothetical protein
VRELIKLETTRGANTLTDILGKLISGQCLTNPFPEEVTAQLRRQLKSELEERGRTEVRPQETDPDQWLEVRLVAALLHELGDPDYAVFASKYVVGVPMGVGVKMPRTPAVFPPKKKWALERQRDPFVFLDDDLVQPGGRGNYASAVGFEKEVEKVLRKQAAKGQVLILPEAEAHRRYPDSLVIASLGAIEKGIDEDGDTEVRVLHDGTFTVRLNEAIRVRDASLFPGAPDLKRLTGVEAESGEPHFALTLDVSDAHKTILIHPDDWPRQACQVRPGEDIFMHKTGTFGIASAGYWWGRFGAAVSRLMLYVLGEELPGWVLLFADDWDIDAQGRNFVLTLLVAAWFLAVLGVPIKWKKCRGGRTFAWIGYERCLKEASLGISESRAAWVDAWMSRIILQGLVLVREMREALGRMVFVYGALEWDQPFLAPLFAFVATHAPGACLRPPVFVFTILKWLRQRLRERRSYPCAVLRVDKGVMMRVDAKAEGNLVVVGGWRPVVDPVTSAVLVKDSPWFSVQLTERSAPWAFHKGEPYKTISALELIASTMGLMVFGPEVVSGDHQDVGVVLALSEETGFTDSQVATAVVRRGCSTSFPLCVIAMELAAQLEARQTRLTLEWSPREVNQQADDLTNEKFDEFEMSRRLEVDFDRLPWKYLPQAMREGMEFYEESAKLRGRGLARPPPAKKRKDLSLRVRDPW